MAPHDFFFALETGDDPDADGMLKALVVSVFRHVGIEPSSAADLALQVREAVVQARRDGAKPCGVQFRAHAGELQVAVSSSGGRVWQLSRPLP